MVAIAGALCNTNQVYLYSKCTSQFVGLTPDGKVLANNNSGQTVTISNVPQGLLKSTGPLNLTLFIEEAQMYVCFTKRWRLVTSKKLQEYCYFYETLENGWFQYRSAVNETKHIGFTKNGKPIRYFVNNRPRQIRDSQCYNLQKVDPRDIDDPSDFESPKRHHSHHNNNQHHHQQQQQAPPQHQQQHHHHIPQHQYLPATSHSHPHYHHHQHQQQQQTKPPIHRRKPTITTSTTTKTTTKTTENIQTSTKQSATEKNRIFQKKHSIRKQNMTNSRRFLLAKNPEHRRILNEEARIKEMELQHFLDYSNDDNTNYSNNNHNNNNTNIKHQQQSDYNNVTKKPSIVSKKVTNNNSGIGPKFRHHAHHGKNHRRKPSSL